MPRQLLPFALLVALELVAACGRRAPETAAAPDAPASVRVINDGFPDMNISVLRGGERVRLGTATGHSTAVFLLPRGLIFGPTPVRFIAEPIGGMRAPVSDEITVSPGDEVTLQIPPG